MYISMCVYTCTSIHIHIQTYFYNSFSLDYELFKKKSEFYPIYRHMLCNQ